MNKTLTVALALAAGLIGGLLTRYIAPPAAFAQTQAPVTTPVTTEIRAQSFTLVDSSDHTLGVFRAEPASKAINPNLGGHTPMRIVLRDSNGREIWSAGGSGIRPVTER
jgi:hypothetical protein